MDRDLVPVGNFNAAPQPVDDNVDVARGQLTGAPDVLVNEPEKIKKVEIRGKLKPTGSPYTKTGLGNRQALTNFTPAQHAKYKAATAARKAVASLLIGVRTDQQEQKENG